MKRDGQLMQRKKLHERLPVFVLMSKLPVSSHYQSHRNGHF
jgi:hypothetical protein